MKELWLKVSVFVVRNVFSVVMIVGTLVMCVVDFSNQEIGRGLISIAYTIVFFLLIIVEENIIKLKDRIAELEKTQK